LEPVKVTRARYRPDRITTLFVGESAPVSGAFFYHGESAMLRYMKRDAALYETSHGSGARRLGGSEAGIALTAKICREG
jgi:hypothetical protein